MGKQLDGIDAQTAAWIGAQHMFFVATAPAGADGHVNLSPKGLATFAVLGPRQVAWLDLTGSGAETLAHLRENGRVTVMFCAFDGAPRILRLYGRGRVVEPQDEPFAELRREFALPEPARSIVVVELTRIATSCGFGVPTLRHEADRPQLVAWNQRKGTDGVRAYQREHNRVSIDGLPALRWTQSVPGTDPSTEPTSAP
jgi:hypothetical protein